MRQLSVSSWLMIIVLSLCQELPATALTDYSQSQIDNISYEELCSYEEPELCKNLKTPNGGAFRKPKKTLLVVFQRFRELIKSIAAKFDVDPRLVAAVIITEHTLNVQIDDVAQDIMTHTNIASNGNFAGVFSFSWGFGQIYTDAAKVAEPIVAEIEGRETKDYNQIAERLKTIDGAVTYASALLLNARRVYKNGGKDEGFDISLKPGILATLYNIGNVDMRFQRTLKENRLPKVGYFGWFVLQNWQLFDEIMNAKIPTFEISASDYESEKVASTGDWNLILEDRYPIYSIVNEIPLFVYPNRCRTNDTGNQEHDHYADVLAQKLLPKGNKAKGKFNILQQSMDCQGNSWALARFNSGAIGWIPQNDELIKQVNFQYEPKTCKQPNYSTCIAQVKNLVGDKDFLQFDAFNGIASIQLVGFPEQKTVDYRRFSESCYEKETREHIVSLQDSIAQDQEKLQSGIYIPRLRYFDLDPIREDAEGHTYYEKEIESLRQEITRAKAKILQEFGIDLDHASPGLDNLFSQIFMWTRYFDLFCHKLCRGPKPEILSQFFVETAPENLRKVDQLFALANKYKLSDPFLLHYSPSRRGSARDGNLNLTFSLSIFDESYSFQLFNLPPEEQFKRLEQSCSALFAYSPKFESEFKKLQNLAALHFGKEYSEDLRMSRDLHIMLSECEIFPQYLDYLNGKRPTPDFDRSICISDSSSCKIYYMNTLISPEMLYFYRPTPTTIEEIALAQFKIVSWEFHDRLNAVSYYLEKLRHASTQKSMPAPQIPQPAYTTTYWEGRETSCQYDPLATIDRIESLLQLKCVDQVLLPAEKNYLLQNFGHPEKRGTFIVMPETDRFEITLVPECDDENSIVPGSIY